MQKLFLSSGVLLILLPSCFAQDAQPQPAPDDVVLQFKTDRDIHEFHIGELIPIKYAYSAKTAGRYLLVDESSQLEGGHPLSISCSPHAEPVAPHPPSSDNLIFDQMLMASCGGAGFGGGVGGGCVDCKGGFPLTPIPVSFGVLPMNNYVRFHNAGTYTCQASSADITTAPRDEKFQPALLAKSNPIVLTILDDPAWAHSAALSYGDAYAKQCRGDDVAQHRFLQCSDLAQRITYLDTADALATEVKLFDGANHGWDNGFWEAIQHSSEPEIALRLMETRMQEPDFEVSSEIVEWLAISDLRLTSSNAFQEGAPAEQHETALESLRKYVRLLGSSLSRKDQTVLLKSLKVYWSFAEQKYCERETLIPTDERNQVVQFLQ
jgi:hypothetical protein